MEPSTTAQRESAHQSKIFPAPSRMFCQNERDTHVQNEYRWIRYER